MKFTIPIIGSSLFNNVKFTDAKNKKIYEIISFCCVLEVHNAYKKEVRLVYIYEVQFVFAKKVLRKKCYKLELNLIYLEEVHLIYNNVNFTIQKINVKFT